ncbi:MAG: endo-1,4-beta-xylanase [Capsulimonas sp.]|uniref:endo-1,4-beta-xylanase n=1 Tax=Capsulimonas sp. TaxID=2494211 RepID=UPI003263F679
MYLWKRSPLIVLLFLFCGLWSQAAFASDDLLSHASWTVIGSPENVSLRIVQAAGLPGGALEEMQVVVKAAVKPFYGAQITAPLAQAPKAGDRIRYRFWGRAASGNPIRAVVEMQSDPWTSLVGERVVLTPQWKEFVMSGEVGSELNSPLAARFQVGEQAGTLEFAGVRVEDLGPDPAMAAAERAAAPQAVAARIRRYRMGTLTVQVKDAKGKAVKNARVKMHMKRHAFLFGSNIFELRPEDNSPDQIRYRTQFANLFNYATLPFYWGSFESSKGQPTYERLDAMADWCLAHRITPKGHPLVWHEVYPSWAPAEPDATVPLLHARATDIVSHYQSRIHYWDVINEATAAQYYSPANGESRWIVRDGAPSVVETALGWARKAGAGVPETFLYNDYNTGPANVALLSQMQKDKALPDAIGVQSHMHEGVWPMAKVWNVCDTFAQFGRPLHFTETTVLSAAKTNGGWAPATVETEKAQADYVEKFYSLLFSHPSLRAITWWDFSDVGAWQNAPAGLIRKDMTPKPAYDRLLKLIKHDWWTDASGASDKGGQYSAQAFYGDYTVTATVGGRSVTSKVWFPEGAGRKTVTLTLR